MGKRFEKLNQRYIDFIDKQKIFFVATAASDGRVNLSPKGMDTFRVINENKIIWLNLTGSGNETATHIREFNRMTIMFCAFEGKPSILRLYGTAKVYHQIDSGWNKYISEFPDLPGARQIFELNIDFVQDSCGMSIPYYNFVGERSDLEKWAEKQGEDKIKDYWKEKNQISIDSKPTGII